MKRISLAVAALLAFGVFQTIPPPVETFRANFDNRADCITAGWNGYDKGWWPRFLCRETTTVENDAKWSLYTQIGGILY